MNSDESRNAQLAAKVGALAQQLQLPPLPSETLANVVEAYQAIMDHSDRLSAWQGATER